MLYALDPLEQAMYVVEFDSWTESQLTGIDLKSTPDAGLALEAPSKSLVHQSLEGFARPTALLSKPGDNVVLESQSGSLAHIMKPNRWTS